VIFWQQSGLLVGARPSMHPLYRPEVDGLRALSVLSVLFFHLEVPPFRGGYVGVDVFFVISGYLITRLIVREIADGQFSLVRFYSRRIRRLFPALFVAVLATFMVAALWFPPEALRNTAEDAIASIASISNLHFWRETHQYFAPDLRTVPLLHTWSLGVEDQFYLIWPVALVFAFRLRASAVPIAILVVSVVSLVLCQMWLARDAVAAFYLTPFRIFELGIGALCVWTERWQPQRAISAELLFGAGLAAILASVFLFDAKTPFPGVNALLPSLGAALIIQVGQRARASALLSNRPAVAIGLISYSLYLVHWPSIVFARYIFGDPGAATRLMLFAWSFGSAALMYFLVEKPFRRSPEPVTARSFARLAARCAALAALVLVPAVLAIVQRGWEWRLSTEQRETLRLQRFGYAPCDNNGLCRFGRADRPLGLQVLGDSNAQHWIAAFDALLSQRGLRGESYTVGGCPMLIGLERIVDAANTIPCRLERERALESIRSSQAPVVISLAWGLYQAGLLADASGRVLTIDSPEEYRRMVRDALERTVQHLGGTNRRFLIIGSQVEQPCSLDPRLVQPGPLQRAGPAPCPPVSATLARILADRMDAMLIDFQQAHPQSVTLLRPVDYLCGSECPVVVDGRWLYQDRAHMTVAGAHYALSHARDLLTRFVEPRAAHETLSESAVPGRAR
jgi:peptidoglycan/LPS O-acetylase OafA/YrhL